MIQCILWNSDPVERCDRAAWVRRCGPSISIAVSPRSAAGLTSSIWVSARHGDYGPSHVAGVIAAFHAGENVRANRTIGVLNHDRGIEDGLKGLPHNRIGSSS